MNFLITVILPTYNRLPMLKRAIGSVLKQTYRNFEVIVVDDGSTDGTEGYLANFPKKGDRYGLNTCPLFVYIRQENRGVSAARNAGIKHAKGKLIALLDSDDEWLPKKLAGQIGFFQKNPEAMICQTEETWIRNGKRVNPMKKHKKHSGWIFKDCLPLCIVSPSAVMMRRELFDQVGNFDESLPACEDYDLWLRVAAKFPIYLIDEPLTIKYGGHADQLSRTVLSLDRYRIKSLEKILNSETLHKEQWNLGFDELKKKCRIYGNGCLKRGKEKEGLEILNLPSLLSSRANVSERSNLQSQQIASSLRSSQ